MSKPEQSSYRWCILALSGLTATFVAAIPFSSMPVLFKEIADDLGLNLVEVGTVWGISSLAGVFISLLAGLLGDRFGFKPILVLSCLLVGITGAARGLSDTFLALAVTVFINALGGAVVRITVTKAIGIWFRGHNLGMANGIVGVGMGLGLMLGPLLSATVVSPFVGGWRNVMYVYGGLSAAVGVVWLLLGREPPQDSSSPDAARVAFRVAFSSLIRMRAVWLIGLTLLFRMGGITGMTGYLPLYLRGKGWGTAAADGALSSFYGVSTLAVVPLATLSDRTGLRKPILFVALVAMALSLILLPMVDGAAVWVLMILSGVFMDCFMSISITMLLETEGVGPAYSGTALGIVFTVAQSGGVVAPPLGNSFAHINAGLPFAFWAALSVAAIATLAFVRETGARLKRSRR